MKKEDLEKFLRTFRESIPSVPQESPDKDKSSRSLPIISSAAVGGLAYLIGPEAFNIPRDGLLDEGVGVSVALFTYFASRLVAPRLCSSKKEQKHVEAWNIARGAGGGAAAGFSAAIGLHILADVALTGGLVTATAAVAALGVWGFNRLNRVK
jgi:hypothetical protein